MSRLISKCWPWLLTLVFGVAVFLFWWRCYPFALSYQEQFQLFLFDGDYLCSRLSEPGGAARYVAEFLVQFYNVIPLGAAIIAVLLMLMQRLTVRSQIKKVYYPLTFIPPVLMWYLMGDESLLLSFPVAIVLVQALMLLCRGLSRRGPLACGVTLLVAVPVGYWLCGPVAVMLAAVPLLVPAVQGRRMPTWTQWLMAAAVVGYVALCVWGSSLLVPYTVSQLFCGLGYYRFFEAVMLLMAVQVVLTAFVPVCLAWLPVAKSDRARRGVLVVQLVACVAACLWFVPANYNAKTYELIAYDFYVRTQQWDKIIAKAEQQQPDLPMSVCATNLALAMQGQLDTRAFSFYQRGSEGLLPSFERNYFTTLTTGEAYFQLGLVNTAQRFAFEAMEAIPNYNKSSRCVRRLAETNLINGNYDVARKYLLMLKKTVFYRKWAQRTEALLGHEELINEHPLYGHQRRVQLDDDFLFSDRELDKICGQLVMKNHDNRMAVQYLLLHPLLNRDINLFMNYLTYVQQVRSYTSPVSQEAITFAYAMRRQQPPQGLVPQPMLQRFNQFMQAYQSHQSLEPFKNTVWYYLIPTPDPSGRE